jgi:hypothetical protein
MKFVGMELGEMLQQRLSSNNSGEDEPKLALPFAAQDLRDGLTALMTVHFFAVGDIIRQKPTCKIYNERYPGEPAIVCEILPEAVIDPDQQASSAYFRTRLTMIIARRGPDGDFNTFHVDDRRYEPVPKDELTLPGDE